MQITSFSLTFKKKIIKCLQKDRIFNEQFRIKILFFIFLSIALISSFFHSAINFTWQYMIFNPVYNNLTKFGKNILNILNLLYMVYS